jgi:hypothetical protein
LNRGRVAPISHRHDWLQRCIDRAGDDCFAWTAIIIVPLGFAILASEFAWARAFGGAAPF